MATDQRIARGMERQLERRRELLDAGHEHLGWKVGLNAPRLMEHLGLEAFVVGCMTAATRLEADLPLSLDGATAPAVEPEIAIHVGSDLGIGWVGAAIEVVDIDLPLDDLEAILAGNIFHAGVLLGAPGPEPAGGVLRGPGGEQPVEAPPRDALERTLETVAARLDEAGESLRPGDVIIAGALVPAVPVKAGDAVELDLGSLGTLELRFA